MCKPTMAVDPLPGTRDGCYIPRVDGFQKDIEEMLDDLVTVLVGRHGDNLVSVVVFGSVGRGQARAGSDVDLLVVFRDLPRDRHERFLVFHEALLELRSRRGLLKAGGCHFDWTPIMLTAGEAAYHSPIYLDMTQDARLLLDRGGFFAEVLARLRARIEELGSRRVRLADGSWYWDLKPGMKAGEVVEL